jgi:hypothetical protein
VQSVTVAVWTVLDFRCKKYVRLHTNVCYLHFLRRPRESWLSAVLMHINGWDLTSWVVVPLGVSIHPEAAN